MEKNWYENWFNNLYPKLYPHRNLEEAKNQVDALINFLDLSKKNRKKDRCLDIACGTGRHVRYLAEQFKQTVGIDLSKDLISIGKENGNFDKAESFIRDMREPKLDENSFDLVCNFFTGFGYFQTDKEHQALANTWLELVKENGILFIDYLNKDYVINNLVSESKREIEGYVVTEKRKINSNRVEKQIGIESPAGKERFKESVRMYSKEEICLLYTSPSPRDRG